MALFKCSSCVFALFLTGVAVVDANDLAKQLVPNGAQPFSIGVSVNPLAKVIEMLQKITDDVLKEDLDEANIFDNFGCFCKDKTKRLVVHVKHHAGQIDVTSATIADNTAQVNNLQADHKKRSQNHEAFSAERDDYTVRLTKENANWASTEATYKNDQYLIGEALKSMKDSKPAASAAFLQVPAFDKLKQVLAIADAMGLVAAPKQKAFAASLLQGGTHANPMDESYGYHEGSDDVIDLVESLNGQMKELHGTQQKEHAKARALYEDTLRGLKRKIKHNTRTMHDILATESTKQKETAEARAVLLENRADLEETDSVLKLITGACESRASEYDRRKYARTQELVALYTAMKCLSNAHSHAKASAAGEKFVGRVELLQGGSAAKPKALPAPQSTEIPKVKAAKKAGADATAKVIEAKTESKALSFLQSLRTQSHLAELSSDQRKKMALDVIFSEGKRVKSVMLTTLGANSAGDPFAKVIKLITDLRWRLEKEEHAELSKQVWCSQQVEETTHERNLYWEQSQDLSAEVFRLDAHIDQLKLSVKRHGDKAIEIGKSLVDIYTDISQLSKRQMQAMSIQKIARDEIKNAIKILRSYYSESAKQASAAGSLLQDTNPADDMLKDFRKERENIRDENNNRAFDEEGRQVERNAKKKARIGDLEGSVPSMGRAGSLGDALALMETIVSDFDREIGNLEGDLDAEHKELVETNAVLTSQKMKAEEYRDLDTQELKTTRINRDSKFNDMQDSMDLLDIALKGLETLKPTCISTGMSYGERVKMRETEMEALRKGLCILGETDDKYGCP